MRGQGEEGEGIDRMDLLPPEKFPSYATADYYDITDITYSRFAIRHETFRLRVGITIHKLTYLRKITLIAKIFH